MNREILFRGKRADNGEWIAGYFLMIEVGGKPVPCIMPFQPLAKTLIENRLYHVAPETRGQYTGLTDKSGKKIFEGDILQCNNNSSDIVKVVFGKFSVIDMETESAVDEVIGWHYEVIPTDALSKIRPFCLSMPLTDYYIDRCNMKIIGNIHDNPELLEGDK